jgi:hypothetical protein
MTEIHLAFVFVTLFFVVISDGSGVLWLLGIRKTLPAKFIHVMHLIVSVGIGGLLLTGGLMVLERFDYLLQDVAFIAKMALVLALVINAFCIEGLAKLATTKTFKELTLLERASVLSSGAVSLIGWLGALILGFTL